MCGKELDDTRDELTIKWYGPRRWWVVTHKRDGEGFCGKADFYGEMTRKLALWGLR